jgi:hypothetical protein
MVNARNTVYTFLATLVLLLGVSLAIVLRSLCLRRRHRRMVEEAIRNGTFHPGMLNPAIDARDRWRMRQNGVVPTPLEKPGLMEVHLGQPMGYSQYTSSGTGLKSVEDESGEDEWRDIKVRCGNSLGAGSAADVYYSRYPLPWCLALPRMRSPRSLRSHRSSLRLLVNGLACYRTSPPTCDTISSGGGGTANANTTWRGIARRRSRRVRSKWHRLLATATCRPHRRCSPIRVCRARARYRWGRRWLRAP